MSTFSLHVLCWEVCPLSECPLSEVSLYTLSQNYVATSLRMMCVGIFCVAYYFGNTQILQSMNFSNYAACMFRHT